MNEFKFNKQNQVKWICDDNKRFDLKIKRVW